MNNRPRLYKSRLLKIAAGLLLLLILGSFVINNLQKSGQTGTSSTPPAPAHYCITSITDTVPFFGQIPPDVGGRYITGAFSQIDINSFAWWEFVSLNWCDAEQGFFGKPFDTVNRVQWEGFITKSQLFPANGGPPASWNSLVAERSTILLKGKSTPTNLKVLSTVGEISDEFLSRSDSTILDSSDAGQADPRNAPNWLGAQDSTNAWYEVRLDHSIYDYVVQNKFYNANNQLAYVEKGTRMSLPFGIANTDSIGAIELKAAWMEVTDISNPKWGRYKLTKAYVQDLNTGQYRQVILALVGLHILHKTQSQQSWVWATFEQVDNVPDPNNPCNTCTYNFNNQACTGCTANQPPDYYLRPGGPGPVPIQVTRVNPLDNNAQAVNRKVQQCIASFYPGSVWQYYELVNVIWSQNQPNNQTNLKKPLNTGLLSLPGTTVANTTLESYVQTLTCFDCHKNATVAGSNTYASDFSFAMGAASSPSLLKEKNNRLMRMLKTRSLPAMTRQKERQSH